MSFTNNTLPLDIIHNELSKWVIYNVGNFTKYVNLCKASAQKFITLDFKKKNLWSKKDGSISYFKNGILSERLHKKDYLMDPLF